MEKKLLATAFTALMFVTFNGQAQAQATATRLDPECIVPGSQDEMPGGDWSKYCDKISITFDQEASSCTLSASCRQLDNKTYTDTSATWNVKIIGYEPVEDVFFENCNGTLTATKQCPS